MVVSRCCPASSALITYTSMLPFRFVSNAIFVPVGSHVGSPSKPSENVSSLSPDASGAIVQRSVSPRRLDSKAIRLPFGDQAGCELFAPKPNEQLD